MKNYLIQCLFFTLLIFSHAGYCQTPNSISVAGKAEVFKKPDVAYITLYLKQHGILTEDAVKKSKEKTEEIRNIISQTGGSDIIGIDIMDLRLGDRSSSSYRPDEDTAPTPEVIKRIRVASKPKPEIVHKIVDAAIRAGALMDNQVRYSVAINRNLGTVVYGLAKFEQAYKKAQKAAISNAELEAKNVADLLGRKAGKILSINCRRVTSVSYGSIQRNDPYPTEFLGTSPEKIRVAATVTVSFELE